MYLTTKDVAERFRVSEWVLFGMRRKGRGPAFIRIGQRVLYPVTAVEDYEKALAAKAADPTRGGVLTTRDLADRWNTTETTLRTKRARRVGPPFVKIGKSVRYRLADIEAFEAANRTETRP